MAADAADKKAEMDQELAEKKIAAAAVQAQIDLVNSKKCWGRRSCIQRS